MRQGAGRRNRVVLESARERTPAVREALAAWWQRRALAGEVEPDGVNQAF